MKCKKQNKRAKEIKKRERETKQEPDLSIANTLLVTRREAGGGGGNGGWGLMSALAVMSPEQV